MSEFNNPAELSQLLEAATPMWEPGEKQGYHAATIGLFEQQLVRRINEQGRSIGRYFREEIAEPLRGAMYRCLKRLGWFPRAGASEAVMAEVGNLLVKRSCKVL